MPKSNRPVMALIDLLSKKWVLRILWELRQSPCTFRELQARCGDISPTMINNRVKELHSAKLLDKSPEHGYCLSPLGEEFIDLFAPIYQFSERWATEINTPSER